MNEIQSAENLKVDAKDKSGSLSLPTTSHEEVAAVRNIYAIYFTVRNFWDENSLTDLTNFNWKIKGMFVFMT